MEHTNYLNLRDSRFKREDVTASEFDEDGSSTVTGTDESITDEGESTTVFDDDDEKELTTTTERPTTHATTTTTAACSTTPGRKHDDEEDDLDDDVTMKKINAVTIDEDDELMLISLDVELRRNIFYTVKIDFQGNMTDDKGLFYKVFGENTDNPRFVRIQRIFYCLILTTLFYL